jgi:hypothetical protein
MIRTLLNIAIAFVAVAALIRQSAAAIITWTSPSGGSFATPANWDSGTVPALGDTARFALSSSYTVTATAGIESSLRFDAGNVDLRALGGFLPQFNRIAVDVASEPQQSASLSLRGAGFLGVQDLRIGTGTGSVGQFELYDTTSVALFGTAIIGGSGGEGHLIVRGGSRLYFPGAGYANIQIASGSTATFSGQGTMNFPLTLGNHGVVSIDSGAVVDVQSSSGTGTVNVSGLGSQLKGISVSYGLLDLSDQATATFNFFGGAAIVHPTAILTVSGPTTGAITVDGGQYSASQYHSGGSVTVQNGGTAAFNSMHGGTMSATGANSILQTNGIFFGGQGPVAAGATIDSQGAFYLIGGGTNRADLRVSSGGTGLLGNLQMGSNAQLVVEQGGLVNATSVTLGGELFGNAVAETILSVLHGSTANLGTLSIGKLGILTGDGVITGNVSNIEGSVQPGIAIGDFTITGAFSQAALGSLEIQFSASAFDHLFVSGHAHLQGTLRLEFDSFVPQVGVLYPILTAGALSGTFDSVQVSGMVPSISPVVSYSGSEVFVHFVPAPSVLTIALSAAYPMSRRRRD